MTIESSSVTLASTLPGPIESLMAGDAVSRALFVVLLAMSIASWAVILGKGFAAWRGARRSQRWLARFWAAPSIDAVSEWLPRQAVDARTAEPFSELTRKAIEACNAGPTPRDAALRTAGRSEDFVARRLQAALDEATVRLESGLSLLATVGATAPFVGLFGTVWGVHHALAGLGQGGSMAIDRIAGPVGEALVMTALGLAVAIPAVVAYNAFARRQRVLVSRLEGHADELIHRLEPGQGARAQAGA